jgi:hypothetical protein
MRRKINTPEFEFDIDWVPQTEYQQKEKKVTGKTGLGRFHRTVTNGLLNRKTSLGIIRSNQIGHKGQRK